MFKIYQFTETLNEMNEAKNLIHKWHEVVGSDDPLLLENIISDDAIFSSPVVFTPMEGKKITMMYLSAASRLTWKSLNTQKKFMMVLILF